MSHISPQKLYESNNWLKYHFNHSGTFPVLEVVSDISPVLFRYYDTSSGTGTVRYCFLAYSPVPVPVRYQPFRFRYRSGTDSDISSGSGTGPVLDFPVLVRYGIDFSGIRYRNLKPEVPESKTGFINGTVTVLSHTLHLRVYSINMFLYFIFVFVF